MCLGRSQVDYKGGDLPDGQPLKVGTGETGKAKAKEEPAEAPAARVRGAGAGGSTKAAPAKAAAKSAGKARLGAAGGAQYLQ